MREDKKTVDELIESALQHKNVEVNLLTGEKMDGKVIKIGEIYIFLEEGNGTRYAVPVASIAKMRITRD